jgi:hypothetical protein
MAPEIAVIPYVLENSLGRRIKNSKNASVGRQLYF